MSKIFGVKVQTPKNFYFYIKRINVVFVVVAIFCFSIFTIYSQLFYIITGSNKIDLFSESLGDFGMYFRRYDKGVSDMLLNLHSVNQSYRKGENIFVADHQQIDDVLDYISNNKKHLTEMGFGQYSSFFNFIIDGIKYKQDLYNLLGANGERNYIIILQNVAEKRPNGGFFGSFGFLTIQSGFIRNFEIIDSYYPNRISDIKLTAPERSWSFSEKNVGFISANKFGFTNIDGRNIKDLYNHIFNNPKSYAKKTSVINPGLFNRTFNKKVHGVIFVRSDMLTKLVPGLQNKLRERQFANANIDLIRKTQTGYSGNFSNKKEIYINQANSYFDDYKLDIFKGFIKNFDMISANKYINVYLDSENIHLDDKFVGFLEKYNLNTNYSPRYAYFRDSNDSYNKIDTFVHKQITIESADDSNTKKIYITGRQDMIDISSLSSGTYIAKIKYMLQVPQSYIDLMLDLENKYGIQMTSRERGILGIESARDFITGEPKRWATRSTIYFPLNFQITDIVGDFTKTSRFQSNFAKGVYYTMQNIENNTEKGIRIIFTVK